MDDDKILSKGGSEEDIDNYASQNGGTPTKDEFKDLPEEIRIKLAKYVKEQYLKGINDSRASVIREVKQSILRFSANIPKTILSDILNDLK